MIRCAFLVVSSETDPVEEETSAEVLSFLRQHLSGLVMMEERRSGSDRYLIEETLRRWCDEGEMDLVLTIGGTFPAPGHSSEQITPEATAAVLERMMPSLPEAMRAFASEEAASALLDRGVAGIRARTLILNLPGEEGLAQLFLEAVVDLLEPILARLRSEPESIPLPVEPVQSSPPKRSGLDADEFAAFLAARRGR